MNNSFKIWNTSTSSLALLGRWRHPAARRVRGPARGAVPTSAALRRGVGAFLLGAVRAGSGCRRGAGLRRRTLGCPGPRRWGRRAPAPGRTTRRALCSEGVSSRAGGRPRVPRGWRSNCLGRFCGRGTTPRGRRLSGWRGCRRRTACRGRWMPWRIRSVTWAWDKPRRVSCPWRKRHWRLGEKRES